MAFEIKNQEDSILGTRFSKYIDEVSVASMALSTKSEAHSPESTSRSDLAVLIPLIEIRKTIQNPKSIVLKKRPPNNTNETKGGCKHKFYELKTMFPHSEKCQRISRRPLFKTRKKLNIQMWKSEHSEYNIIIRIEYSDLLYYYTCLNIPGERTPIYSKSVRFVLFRFEYDSR